MLKIQEPWVIAKSKVDRMTLTATLTAQRTMGFIVPRASGCVHAGVYSFHPDFLPFHAGLSCFHAGLGSVTLDHFSTDHSAVKYG
jgi:hypothetical protein